MRNRCGFVARRATNGCTSFCGKLHGGPLLGAKKEVLLAEGCHVLPAGGGDAKSFQRKEQHENKSPVLESI